MFRSAVCLACLLLVAGIARGQEPVPERPKSQPTAIQKPAGKLPVLPEPVTRSSGKLFIQENAWDFGHVAQDVQVTHRFTIENVGDDTLFLVRIKPT